MFDISTSAIRYETPPAGKVLATRSRMDRLLQGPKLLFAPGGEIFAEGDGPGALYYVASGFVRVYRMLAEGRRQICAFHMPGEIFGFEAGAQRLFCADAVTATALHVLRPRAAEELSHELLKLALSSVNRAHDHLLTLGRLEAVNRVAGFLLEMIDRQESQGDGILDLPMGRSDIADYLGLTAESVSRAMTRLRASGIIRLPTARRVDVLRKDALRALAD